MFKTFIQVSVKIDCQYHFQDHEKSCNFPPFIKEGLGFLIETGGDSFKIMIDLKNFCRDYFHDLAKSCQIF